MPDAEPTPELSFREPPGAIPVFLKAALDRRPAALEAGAPAPRIRGQIDRLTWTGALLGRFRSVCGFPDTGPLPLTFPHVLAAGLHGRMLQRPEFPVRLPGLIHVWHEIRQTRPIAAEEKLAMACAIEGYRLVRAGAEFCLETTVTSGGECIWQEKTGFISRTRTRGNGSAERSDETPVEVHRQVARWKAAAGVGRRYARASGDYNPIHLHDAAARRFGFPAAIAHGMWTLSRAVAELEADGQHASTQVRVRFKRPVFIPCELVLRVGDMTAEGLPFQVSDPADEVTYLQGVCSI